MNLKNLTPLFIIISSLFVSLLILSMNRSADSIFIVYFFIAFIFVFTTLLIIKLRYVNYVSEIIKMDASQLKNENISIHKNKIPGYILLIFGIIFLAFNLLAINYLFITLGFSLLLFAFYYFLNYKKIYKEVKNTNIENDLNLKLKQKTIGGFVFTALIISYLNYFGVEAFIAKTTILLIPVIICTIFYFILRK